MMFNATAAAHSSEEAGQFSSNIADLDALRELLDVLATTQRAPQTWARVGPVLTELGALSPGVAADAKVVEVEGLLRALSGEEQYSSWVLRDGDGAMVNVPLPEQVMGGSERASILVLWNGEVYQPQVSDSGVDWQDIGVPRIRTNSTGWVGSPSLSTESPARWIGAVTLVLAEQREITGRVVTAASDTLSGVTVRGSAAVLSSYRETIEQEVTTTGADGRFTLMVTQGPEVRLSLAHPSARPTGPLPSVPAGDQDVDLGDILVSTSPTIASLSATPERPERGGTITLDVVASHPFGSPLTYTWERQSDGRWSWEVIGQPAQDNSQVELTAPATPKTIHVRVTVSDGTFEIIRWLSVTPANHSPEILSLLAEIGSLQTDTPQLYAGRELDFIATARDADGDPLTYRWSLGGTTSEGNVTWKSYWSSDDRIYIMRLRVSDGALYD